MSSADGILDAAGFVELRTRHWGEADIPEHHHQHPCDACRLLITLDATTKTGHDQMADKLERIASAIANTAYDHGIKVSKTDRPGHRQITWDDADILRQMAKELRGTDGQFAKDAGRTSLPWDPLVPQWEMCKTCGGDHWTKDHQNV